MLTLHEFVDADTASMEIPDDIFAIAEYYSIDTSGDEGYEMSIVTLYDANENEIYKIQFNTVEAAEVFVEETFDIEELDSDES